MSEKQTPNPEFIEQLAESLDHVFDGHMKPSEAAAAHPQYAAEMQTELEAALLASHIGAIDPPQMDAAKVATLERRLRSEMQARQDGIVDEVYDPTVAASMPSNKVLRFPTGTLSRIAAILVAALVMIGGGGGGLVAVSADALPGDVLYPIKRGWESVQLTVGTLTGQGDNVRRDQVETRLEEALTLAEHGELNVEAMSELEAALDAYVTHSDKVEFSVLLPLMERIRAALDGSLVIEGAGDLQAGILALTGPTVTPSPTVTPTATLTETPTITPTSTTTPTMAETPADAAPPVAASPTRTPRIPPTPSRTPTATTTSTVPPTVTVPPTATITAVPMVVPVVTAAPATEVPDSGGGSTGPNYTAPTQGPSPTWYPWMQATSDAIDITKTADASENP